MTSPTEHHNAVAGQIMISIVKPIIDRGGSTSEVMVLLESVVAGTLTACAAIDGKSARHRDGMLMGLEAGVRQRLDTIPITRRGT